MRTEALFILWALSAVTRVSAETVADSGGTHSLRISAAAATVAIAARTDGGSALRLPALEFVFQLRPACAAPFRASSVSLTVADSRRALNAEQLEDETATPELHLTVPASQLAPVLVTDFCSTPQSGTEMDATSQDGQNSESLTLPATLSANASLLCVSENKREIVYTTAPLDLILVCGPVEEAAE